ncbi:hypothetical protein [Anaerotignum sp.]
MWFLEWEENREAHEKKCRKWTYLAVFCFVAALATMFLTEKMLFDGIVETNTGVLLSAVIGVAIAFFMERDSLKIKVEKERNKKAEYLAFLVVTAGLFGISAINGQVLLIIQWICLAPAALWLTNLMDRKEYDKNLMYSFALVVVSLIMLVTTVFGPRLMRYQNVYAAERIVTAEGYEEAEYLGWLKGAWVYQDAVDKSFYEEEMEEEKYYMVFGRKDGEPYRFIIDPKGGEIILAASEKEEPELGNWYRSREGGL